MKNFQSRRSIESLSKATRTSLRFGLLVLATAALPQAALHSQSAFSAAGSDGATEVNPGAKASLYAELVPHHLLGLVHAPEVHDELKLTAAQVQKLEEHFADIDGLWFRSRVLPNDQQYPVLSKLESSVWTWFKKNATEEQRQRLAQLEYRAQGVRMLLRPELVEPLGLTSAQQAKLAGLAKTSNAATQKLQQATMDGNVTDKLKDSVRQAMTAEQAALKSVFRPEQLQKLGVMLGEPFETSSLKRIYPMAPQLIDVEHWLNTQPLSMQDLRGKVVLVHFYAFQCHNCHANFDHYRNWHEELRDKGVVVLGIQTPETSKERDPQAVTAAAQERKLDFPIMIDLQSENWKAWSNTMWPTVYVVDKNGYIRQWWQGELNWNGATGDQTIEALVDQLLAEEV